MKTLIISILMISNLPPVVFGKIQRRGIAVPLPFTLAEGAPVKAQDLGGAIDLVVMDGAPKEASTELPNGCA